MSLTIDTENYLPTGLPYDPILVMAAIAGAIILINAVTEIADGVVVNDHILNGTINAYEKILAESIQSEQIAANAITATRINANAVTTDKLAADSITSVKISSGAITTDKLYAGAVTASKISVTNLEAISANLGSVTAGTVTGATLQTGLTGSRVQINSAGMSGYDVSLGLTFRLPTDGNPPIFASGKIISATIIDTTIESNDFRTSSELPYIEIKDAASGGIAYRFNQGGAVYGTDLYGTGVYGEGTSAHLFRIDKPLLWVGEEWDYADIHLYNRLSNPSETAEIGDIACVNSVIVFCTGAGKPGTYKTLAFAGANSDITSMTGLSDDGIPLAKVANAASDGANSDITSMTGLSDDGIPLAKVANAASDGANSDITSLAGLTTALSVAQGGTGSTTQNFVDNDGTVNPTNLLNGASFENWSAGTSAAPDGWTLELTPTIARDTGDTGLGSYSVKITGVGAAAEGINQTISNLKKSTKYTLLIRTKVTAGDTASIITTGATTNLALESTSTDWETKTGTFTTDASGTNVVLKLLAKADGDIVYFDGAMLVEGESAFAFSPKPVAENMVAFSAHPTADQTNITAGATTDIAFGTEDFDIGSNFASNTFTAPVNGYYLFSYSIVMSDIDTDCTGLNIILNTGAGTRNQTIHPDHLFGSDGYFTLTGTFLIYLTAAQTAKMQIEITGGANQLDITNSSYFMGHKIV